MSGRLVVITGPMFSGKSRYLLDRLTRIKLAHEKVLCLKPSEDSRQNTIRWRAIDENGQSVTILEVPAYVIQNPAELDQLIAEHDPDALVIDEAQFFGPWIVSALNHYHLNRKTRIKEIYVSGLDLDAWGRPFGSMGTLMAYADEVHKLKAVCSRCGREAGMTQKWSTGNGLIEAGDKGLYDGHCRDCWHPPDPGPIPAKPLD